MRIVFQVTEWKEENKAQIVPGVIFIDEVRFFVTFFYFTNNI